MSSPSSFYLIDGVGPFFRGLDRINIDWSKIPWSRLDEMRTEDRHDFFQGIGADLEAFSRSVINIGYTGIILDDVFHLACHPFYEDRVAEKIEFYRGAFTELFRIIRKEGLQIYLTMDLLDISPDIEKKIGKGEKKHTGFLAVILESVFGEFPDIAGVILHAGQGQQQRKGGVFPGHAVFKTPDGINRCVKSLLSVFEKHRRKCIFRTPPNSDLTRIADGIESHSLILSLPYSETGAFRYVSLNRDFFATDLPTIIELPARREHEGCGEYPAFIGYQYEKFAVELSAAPNLAGISVSCQTGGESPFRRLAFVDDDAIWTEINAFVALRIFKYGELVEESVSRLPEVPNPTALLELLRLSEESIGDLLYFPDFARRYLRFGKRRFGPQIGIYRSRILLSHSIRRILKEFVIDPESCIRSGETALARIRRMRMLALECNLSEADIEFMESTFDVLAFSREYYLRPDDEVLKDDLLASVKRYRAKYPRNGERTRYGVTLDLEPKRLNGHYFRLIISWLKSRKLSFRLINEMIRLDLISRFAFLLKPFRSK